MKAQLAAGTTSMGPSNAELEKQLTALQADLATAHGRIESLESAAGAKQTPRHAIISADSVLPMISLGCHHLTA